MNHLLPTDVVPKLRTDLDTAPPPTGTGADVIQVGPDGMTMHGFEFSVARMLDGKRTVEEVIRNCERLGLPVDLRALEGFLNQLQAHGMIARGGEEPVSSRIRVPWSQSTRELYCAALRSARLGDYAAAERRIEELLWIAPQTAEALRLLELLLAPPEKPEAFQKLLLKVEDRWRAESVQLEPALVVADAPVEELSRNQAFTRKSRLTRPLFLAGVAVPALVALTFIPIPRVVSASANLAPVASTPVLATEEGEVKTVLVREGEQVEAGAPLFVWVDGDLQARLAEAREALEENNRPLREKLAEDPTSAPMIAELRQAETELARAQTALLAGQKDAAGRKDDVTHHLEAQFALAETRVRELRGAVDRALTGSAEDAAESMEFAADVKRLESELTERTVRAPVAGTVRALKLTLGQEVSAQEQVLKLDDPQMKVVAALPPKVAKTVKAGEKVSVRVDGRTFPATIDSVSGRQITATLPAGVLSGPAVVDFELRPATIWQRL